MRIPKIRTPKSLSPEIMRGAADRRADLTKPVQNTERGFGGKHKICIKASDDASEVSVKISSPGMESTVIMAAGMYELSVFELWRVFCWIDEENKKREAA
jgi:hypothetical protein